MIITEYLNNNTLVHHCSDANLMILQNETGIMYSEAIDVVPCRYTYTETDIPIDVREELNDELVQNLKTLEEKALAYDIITGGAENE